MKKKTQRKETVLELDGTVSIVDKLNGRVVKREQLDGEVVLKVLLHFITEACERVINDRQFRDSLKEKVRGRT